MTNADKVHFLQTHPAKGKFHNLLFDLLDTYITSKGIRAFTLPGKLWKFEEELLKRKPTCSLDAVEKDPIIFPILVQKADSLSQQFLKAKINVEKATDLEYLKNIDHNGYSFVWCDRMASFYVKNVEA